MSIALLIMGVAAALATLCALVRVKHPSLLSFPIMMLGWLTGELALFHLALQVAATAVLVILGALDETSGWIGLVGMGLSWVGLILVHRRSYDARPSLAAALVDHHPQAAQVVEDGEVSPATLRRPFSYDKSDIDLIKDVPYGPLDSHRLDIYRPAATAPEPRPIMVYIHGGGWVSGAKDNQGLPLLHQLAKHGWLAVTVNYRLGPKNRFPAQIDDVELALRWVREHGAEYGGAPDFVAVSGGSAGGHLASLAALRSAAATPVSACIPVYGSYDFTDRHDIRGSAEMRPFLERMVMPTKLADDRSTWEATSPLYADMSAAPPFFVIHGANDVLLWREETRVFVDRLMAESPSPVSYAEVPGAQHAFDMFHSVRSAAAVDAIIAFVDAVYAEVKAQST